MAAGRDTREEAIHRVAVKRAYELFQRGSPLTDEQVQLLVDAIEAAEPLLAVPAYKLAQFFAAQDLVRLRCMQYERKRRAKAQ
jgi:hypothetical protein